MAYPAQINPSSSGAPSSLIQRAGRRSFAPGAGDVRYAFVGVSDSGIKIRAFKSTDAGETWADLDTANEPLIETDVGELQFDAIQDPDDPDIIILAWVAPGARTSIGFVDYIGEYSITTFDMSSDAWGTPSTGGPQAADSNTTASGGEPFTGLLFNVCKDTADGSYWLSYLIVIDASTADPINGAGSFLMRPAIRQLSAGTWGAEIPMVGDDADLANYRPNGIAIGDGSLVHVAMSKYDIQSSGGYSPTNDWMQAYHQSYDPAGPTFGTLQQIEDRVYTGGDFTGTISPLVTRQESGSTELLFGWGLADATDEYDQQLVTQRIARAISATDPTWTIETLPGIDNTGNGNGNNNWSAPVTDAAGNLVAYTNYTDSGPNLSQVRLNVYASGAWQAAVDVFAAPVDRNTIGDSSYLNLCEGGAIAVVISGEHNNEDYYYEFVSTPALTILLVSIDSEEGFGLIVIGAVALNGYWWSG